MYDTPIMIVGNVLTAPEWRRTKNQTLVANFRVASTSRRYDRDTGRWMDGDSLRVRVSCWRRLAENVSASVAVGDPIIVTGRLYTRDWVDGDNNPRVTFEMEASAVGHDLARGRTKLFRTKPASVTSAEGPDTDGVVRGETAEPVPDQVSYGDGIPDGEQEPVFLEEKPEPDADPVATMLAGGGFEPFDKEMTPAEPAIEIEVEKVEEEEPGQRRTRRPRKQPVGV